MSVYLIFGIVGAVVLVLAIIIFIVHNQRRPLYQFSTYILDICLQQSRKKTTAKSWLFQTVLDLFLRCTLVSLFYFTSYYEFKIGGIV